MARILVIDDDAAVRTAVRVALERVGHEVIDAANGAAGLRAFAGSNIALVITDVLMPERDGVEVVLQLRSQRPSLPVLAISGGGDTHLDKAHLLDTISLLGATRVLGKPFSIRELQDIVSELLASSASPAP